MKKALSVVSAVSLAVALSAGLWVVGCKSSAPTAAQPKLTLAETNAGMQFPVAEAALQTIRQSQNAQGLNDHAWMLFHDLVGAGGDPKWEDWCAISDQIPDQSGAGTVNLICPPTGPATGPFALSLSQRKIKHLILGLSAPRQGEVVHHGGLFAAGSDILEGAEVMYNPDLAAKIKSCATSTQTIDKDHFTQSLMDSGLLGKFPDTSRAGCKVDATSQDILPYGSIAIKTIWLVADGTPGYPLPAPPGKEHDTLTSDIPIWHSSPGNPGQLESNYIQIDLSDPACDMSTPSAALPGSIVPIGCFYSIPTTLQALAIAMGRKNLQTVATGGTNVSLILLGFHVATREMKNWTWQTYWWSGDAPDPEKSQTAPTSGPYAITDAHWQRYAVRTTLGAPNSYTTPPADLPLDSVANPYLEGRSTSKYGNSSDCLNCHKYAVFNRKAPTLPAFVGVQTCGFNPNDPNCSVLKSAAQRASYFSSGKSTEFLWSLADSNVKGLHANGPKNFLDKIDSFMAQIDLKAKATKQKVAPARKP